MEINKIEIIDIQNGRVYLLDAVSDTFSTPKGTVDLEHQDVERFVEKLLLLVIKKIDHGSRYVIKTYSDNQEKVYPLHSSMTISVESVIKSIMSRGL